MKKLIITLSICLLAMSTFSQSKTAKELYDSFKIYRTNNDDKPNQIVNTLVLLKLSDQLTAKQVTNVNYNLGRLYEEIEQPDNAIPYYEQSLIGEPNYEVIHRALGFIYLAKSGVAAAKINEAKAKSDVEGSKNAFAAYKGYILKAIPHLEKYQACDPDEETLNIIINLYKSLKDSKSVETLNARLKEMSGKCVNLLEDE